MYRPNRISETGMIYLLNLPIALATTRNEAKTPATEIHTANSA
jgi:hypothetical protein